jgi:hypothetical protein
MNKIQIIQNKETKTLKKNINKKNLLCIYFITIYITIYIYIKM